jgi:DNA processing protein
MMKDNPNRLQEILAAIRLTRTEGIGAIAFRKLRLHYGSCVRAVEAGDVKDKIFTKIANRAGALFTPDQAAREYDAGLKAGLTLCLQGDPEYSPLLACVRDAPPFFWYAGNPEIFRRPACGIVGSRNASLSAQIFSAELAEAIAGAGYCVVSGLARGADGAAHAKALQAPGGTVAVIAGGADVIYPSEHQKLYHDIVNSGGAVVSENYPGAEPIAKMFPRRNRIISGFSLGVIVTEATLKSGSLTTARFALEQGREVFAVPGFPADPRSHGCNNLLKDGAVLVRNADDVLPVLQELRDRQKNFSRFGAAITPEAQGGFTLPLATETQPGITFSFADLKEEREENDETRKILSLLGGNDITIDEIIRFSGLTTEVVLTMLPQLEFSGKIIQTPGGAYRAV